MRERNSGLCGNSLEEGRHEREACSGPRIPPCLISHPWLGKARREGQKLPVRDWNIKAVIDRQTGPVWWLTWSGHSIWSARSSVRIKRLITRRCISTRLKANVAASTSFFSRFHLLVKFGFSSKLLIFCACVLFLHLLFDLFFSTTYCQPCPPHNLWCEDTSEDESS